MKPDSDKTKWQQPAEQNSGAPFTTVQDESKDQKTPDEPVGKVGENPPAADNKTDQTTDTQEPDTGNAIHWQASEYIHREKNNLWFIVFGIVVLAFMAIAIFVIQSITFAILVPVMALTLFFYVRRPPRILDYTLSQKGLHINDELYEFNQFKSFGVIRDGEDYSIMLLPVKRFHPGVLVYFPKKSGEEIVDMLAGRLPMEELKLDFIDNILRKLRI